VNHRKTRTSTTFRRETPFAQQQIRAPLTPRELRVNKKGKWKRRNKKNRKSVKRGKRRKIGKDFSPDFLKLYFEL
jgi:hypothetical protein